MPRAWLWPSICPARMAIWIVTGRMGTPVSNSIKEALPPFPPFPAFGCVSAGDTVSGFEDRYH